MIAKLVKILFLWLSAQFLWANSSTFEHLVWDKTPIHLSLPIEQERMLIFPYPATILDNELEGFAIIQKTKDTFYIKALKAFSSRAVVLRLNPNGEVLKLNLSAKETYTNTKPIQILFPEEPKPAVESAANPSGTSINFITLTRFAIQSLYSPERLVEMPEGVERVAMRTTKRVTLVSGGGILAHPLQSFSGDGLVVTAIRINNLLSQKQSIEPDALYGKWESIAFYPSNTLSPKGSLGDETVVFVTSRKPFGEALNESQEYLR